MNVFFISVTFSVTDHKVLILIKNMHKQPRTYQPFKSTCILEHNDKYICIRRDVCV